MKLSLLIAIIYISPSWQQHTDLLLVVFEKAIERINPLTGHSDIIHIEDNGDGETLAIDFDFKHNCFFYSTYPPGRILQKCVDGRQEETIIAEDVGLATGLSYDSTSDLLYFRSTKFENKIEVVKVVHPNVPMKNYMRRTIVGNLSDLILTLKNKMFAGDVLVAPVQRYIFWTDISINNLSIWRSNLDGSDVRKIVNNSFSDPLRLSLDYNRNRIHWTERHENALGSCDFNGNNIEKVTINYKLPDGIVISQGRLYWMNSETQSIYTRDKGDVSVIFHSTTFYTIIYSQITVTRSHYCTKLIQIKVL